MTLTVTISSVDGETHHTLVTPDAVLAYDYLAAHDHEGSVTSLVVQVYNDDVYDVLRCLQIDRLHVDDILGRDERRGA